jgi:hypothetical protein
VTITSLSRTTRPIDLFRTGDHIQVIYARSKHYGRTGSITRVCNPRLSVHFDDGQAGSYVDFRYARITPAPDTTTHNNGDGIEAVMIAVKSDTEDEEDNSLVGLMESLAIQTAVSALAEANDMADVERAIDEQATRIRAQARHILQRQSNSG